MLDYVNNPGYFILFCAVISNLTAQFLKFILNIIITKKVDFKMLFTTGSMPSSHTSSVFSALLATSIALGANSAEFAIMFILAAIVIHDALGVRRHAGRTAEMLNHLVLDLSDLVKTGNREGVFKNPKYDRKLKELLGHEPIEVFGGIIHGSIVVAIIYYFFL